MNDAQQQAGVLPSPKGESIPVDVAKIFIQYDKNKTGAIEVSLARIFFCMNLPPRQAALHFFSLQKHLLTFRLHSYSQIDELRDFMANLGLLNGRSPAESNAIVVSAFANADSDKDNALNLSEFTKYYHRATAPRLGDVLKAENPEDMIALRLAFNNWASFGSGNSSGGSSTATTPGASPSRVQLGSAHWLKICRDTGLVGRGALNSTDADLIFAKVKPRGLQKINFSHFVDALGAVAARLNKDLLAIVRQVTTSQGPVVNTTNVYTTKLSGAQQQQQQHRRRSAPDYFAPLPFPPTLSQPPHSRPTSAKEKPFSNTDTNNTNTESAPLNNDVGNDDGFKIPAHRSDSSQGGRSSSAFGGGGGGGDNDIVSENDRACLSGNIEQVLHVFGEFAGFGAGSGIHTGTTRNSFGSTMTGRFSTGNSPSNSTSMPSPMKMEMDSKQFLKLCKDSGLMTTTPATPTAAVDLCFAKAKARGARRLAFADFLVALALLAQEKNCAEAEVLAQVAACSGPRRNSTTTPEFTRLHDNKETYTGVYARGGPKTVDSSVPDLAKLLSREQGRQI
jgi:p25-alpha